MSEENKNLDEEQVTEVTDAVEEQAAEIVEESVATTEEENFDETVEMTESEPVDETSEVTEPEIVDGETAENAENALETEKPEETPAKKVNKTLIGIIAAAVVIIAAIVVILVMLLGKNPYEKDYVDVDGVTIGEIANDNGMELADFLEYYGLPEDMPASTFEKAAFYNIPAGKYAEMNSMEFSQLGEILGWDETITEETTIGDALDKTKLSNYVGEENLSTFKEEYGLDESITGDTLFGEVRNIVDTKIKEQYEAQKAAEEEPEKTEDSDEAENSDDAENSGEAEATEEASEAPAEQAE